MRRAREVITLPENIKRVCRDCGRCAPYMSVRQYANGVRYAKWYHCAEHAPYVPMPRNPAAEGAYDDVIRSAAEGQP